MYHGPGWLSNRALTCQSLRHFCQAADLNSITNHVIKNGAGFLLCSMPVVLPLVAESYIATLIIIKQVIFIYRCVDNQSLEWLFHFLFLLANFSQKQARSQD